MHISATPPQGFIEGRYVPVKEGEEVPVGDQLLNSIDVPADAKDGNGSQSAFAASPITATIDGSD